MFYNTLQNAIINGGFNFWQRGTTFTAIASGVYFADKWKNFKVGSAVHTMGRSVDVPPESTSPYSGIVTVTTAQASMGVNDFTKILTYIEGNFASKLYGKNVVLAFWVKSTKVGNYSCSFYNSGVTKSMVKDFVINVANTWERKIVRFNIETTGTWLKDTGKGLEVNFFLATGANLKTATPNIWGNNVGSSASQVNLNDTINATFQVADIVLVEDNTEQTRVPNFVMAGRDYAEELILCQRYYEKSYAIDTPPASVTSIGAYLAVCVSPGASSWHTAVYQSRKRITPSVVTYAPSNGAAGAVDVSGTPVAASAVNSSDRSFGIGAGSSTNQGVVGHWTADADF